MEIDSLNTLAVQRLNATSRKRLTVICPVYNEESVVPLFFERFLPVAQALAANYEVELLFLNNASTDGTLSAIERLRQESPWVYVLTLSANRGYQRSLECGLRNARGDLFAFIDVDCEDPPEMILDFVRHYEAGYDIVYGERVDREEGKFIKFMRKLFYQLVHRVSDDDFILYMAEFSLFTAEVRDAIVDERSNSFPFIRSSIARVGFSRIGIAYKRHARIAGKTNYNFMGMTIFAVAGLLSASTLPLRLPIYLLPFWLLAVGIVGAVWVQTGSAWWGLAELLVVCSYIGATLAFIALYVARTYKNGLGRPNYAIHGRLSISQND
jgi:glycosyltransferase involved in cell wall biosynthesis